MDGRDRNLILFDFLPSLARDLYTDEYKMLRAGCWTEEVKLRQSSGHWFTRRLRVQLSGSPIEWGDWGTGEGITASERMPMGLLKCVLYAPHHWLSRASVTDFFSRFDPVSARDVLKRLCGGARSSYKLTDHLPLLDDPSAIEKSVLLHRLVRSVPSGVDLQSLQTFVELLKTVGDDMPRGGPPSSGLAFVRELHRRLLSRGVRADRVHYQIRELVFGTYLPGRDAGEVATRFFAEVLRLLSSAVGRKPSELSAEELERAVIGMERIARMALEGEVKPKKTLEDMGRLILEVVYGGHVPSFGNPPDYLKWLKVTSLVEDHGYDMDRVSSVIGVADTDKTYGQPTAQGMQRLETYLHNGRAIRRAIPLEFLSRNHLSYSQ